MCPQVEGRGASGRFGELKSSQGWGVGADVADDWEGRMEGSHAGSFGLLSRLLQSSETWKS